MSIDQENAVLSDFLQIQGFEVSACEASSIAAAVARKVQGSVDDDFRAVWIRSIASASAANESTERMFSLIERELSGTFVDAKNGRNSMQGMRQAD
jgi:hypothetical protein